MLEEISCWKIDWTAIGSVLTGVGAITAAITAGIALHVGMEPRRLQQEKERRRAGVAAFLLLAELYRLRAVGETLSNEQLDYKKIYVPSEAELVSKSLQCPHLKSCLDTADSYPEKLVTCMGIVFAFVCTMDLKIQHVPVSGKHQEHESHLRDMAARFIGAVDTLSEELKRYVPPKLSTSFSGT